MKQLFISLVFLLILFLQLKAQPGFKIEYYQYSYDSVNNILYKWEIGFISVFNDSFYYSYISTPKANNKIQVYAEKPIHHSRIYSEKSKQWYHISKLSKNRPGYLEMMKPQNIKWNILPDSTKMILGYKTTKAWTIYNNGYQYIWFTKAIPKTYGPISGNHYPGLVLEWYEQRRNRLFRAYQIDSGNYKIVMPKYKIKKVKK